MHSLPEYLSTLHNLTDYLRIMFNLPKYLGVIYNLPKYLNVLQEAPAILLAFVQDFPETGGERLVVAKYATVKNIKQYRK